MSGLIIERKHPVSDYVATFAAHWKPDVQMLTVCIKDNRGVDVFMALTEDEAKRLKVYLEGM